ncbi:MAG TPA: carbohydrate-binding family 9-like protein [Armatimonadota bacterium]|jgi:hypothetical protein
MSNGNSGGDTANYTCLRAPEPVRVDGRLNKPAWSAAPRSGRFVDIVTGDPAFFDTRMASLWDDRALYVAFWLDEPDVRASFTERDSFIWFDHDAELFIGGDDCYYEFEINAHGTVYEVFFVWQDALKAGSRFDTPEFDLRARNVDVLGGFQDPSRYGKHPRGKRWAFMDWDFPGLETGVSVDGTLNDSSDVDKGWVVEMALPWEGFKSLLPSRSFPPKEGDTLRMQFFRFEALRTLGKTIAESPGWSLNAHGVYDSHLPEKFATVHFTERTAGLP